MNSAATRLNPTDVVDKKMILIRDWLRDMSDDDLETRVIWFTIELGVRFPEFKAWREQNRKNNRLTKPNLVLIKA